MVALTTPVVNIGWNAMDFSLKGTDGKMYSLKNVRGEKGLLVMFICNHCPFVKAIVDKLVVDVKTMQKNGIGVVAISSNDAVAYPEDSFDNMVKFARKHGFTFPYVIDETQAVAHGYGAVCTPDFFGFDANGALQYRGRFDSAGMTPKPDSEHDLLKAMLEISITGKAPPEQIPSIGCNIKWKEA
ncbi:MAG: thioredoxin family protein [Proteobacteria bacterium]|nr:thioredoxin family protein [Pseudomonadota bacterium]